MTTATEAPPEVLMTAEQFLALPGDGRVLELVRGKVIEMPPPGFRHGFVCMNVGALLWSYVRERNLGRVICNDSGVVTRRDPDSVRGPDVAYFSFATLPADQQPIGYPTAVPDLVFEVRSPSDRIPGITTKAGEYETAGVKVVCVLDPDAGILAVYPHGELPRRYTADEELTLPEVFPDFRAAVRSFLE